MATWKIIEARGKWCLEFEDATGRRRREVARDKRGQNSKEIAEATLRQRYKQVISNEYVAPSHAIRFDELCKRFIASKVAEVRNLTVKDYQAIVTHRLIPFFGAARLSGITRHRVEQLRTSELERGQGWRSVNKTLTLAVMIFNYARLNGWMAANPAEGIRKIPRPQAHQDELDGNVLSPAEAQALLAKAEERAHKGRLQEAGRRARKPDAEPQRRLDHAPACYHALIATGLLTGLRESELLALTWGEVDLDARTLRVVARYRKGETGDPKSATSRRTVPMPDALIRILRAWYVASPHKADEALVFGTALGKHENHSNVLKRGLRPALVSAGITRTITLHDLRHTYASSLIRAGIDVLRVARLLGHASADITLRVYGHLIQQDRDDAAEKLQELMLGQGAGFCNRSVTTAVAIGDTTNQSGSKLLSLMVPEIGIEPTTRALRMRCSTN
jgi:integrase